MADELALSLNIVLDPHFVESVRNVQNELRKQFDELRKYDTTPHLAVITKFILPLDVEKYADKVVESLQKVGSFTLQFDSIVAPAGGKYIFIEASEQSKEAIYEINNIVLKETKGIGLETPGGLPSKYAYVPHISLIKVEENELDSAFTLVNSIDPQFLDQKFKVNKLELTMENRRSDGPIDFPTIRKIELIA